MHLSDKSIAEIEIQFNEDINYKTYTSFHSYMNEKYDRNVAWNHIVLISHQTPIQTNHVKSSNNHWLCIAITDNDEN